MPQLTIRVKLPSNRLKSGTLELIDPLTGLTAYGPVPVLGRAARDDAKNKGNNPDGISTKAYGDTPLGTYDITSIRENGEGTSRPIEKYGRSGSIVLDPTDGDALTAKRNGRTGLLIHAGRQPNSPTPLPSHLRPTNGCLRILDGDLALLIDKIRQMQWLFPGKVTMEVTSSEGPSGTDAPTADEGDPPPLGGTIIIP